MNHEEAMAAAKAALNTRPMTVESVTDFMTIMKAAPDSAQESLGLLMTTLLRYAMRQDNAEELVAVISL